MEDISKKIPFSLRAFEGAYGEKENIPIFFVFERQSVWGWRVARVVKKGTCRYKILRALTILVRFKKKNGAYTENENITKKLFF